MLAVVKLVPHVGCVKYKTPISCVAIADTLVTRCNRAEMWVEHRKWGNRLWNSVKRRLGRGFQNVAGQRILAHPERRSREAGAQGCGSAESVDFGENWAGSLRIMQRVSRSRGSDLEGRSPRRSAVRFGAAHCAGQHDSHPRPARLPGMERICPRLPDPGPPTSGRAPAAARLSSDLAAEPMEARHTARRHWTRSSGRLPRRVNLSIQSPHFKPSGPVRKHRQTTIRWGWSRQVNILKVIEKKGARKTRG